MNNIGTKGVWAQENPQGIYSLINEEISLPTAVIKQSALSNNLNWMQKFADHHQVKLSPHGKTTMTVDFFTEQLNAGAWGITIATPRSSTNRREGWCKKYHYGKPISWQSQHGYHCKFN